MDPIISIIVPIYNVDKYLSRCIDSILNQTFKKFELILVNDGSTDNSGVVCEEYANKDNRIKVIHKSNGGVSSARNSGLHAAKGEYIGFVDPDDYIEKDMFNTLYSLCKGKNADISICKNCREINGVVNRKNEPIYIKELTNEEAVSEVFKANLYRFALWNKLCKKTCFNGIIFPEGRIHEDLSVTYKIIANANKVIFTNYIGYIYVKREESILTKKYNENRLQAFIGWNEIFEFVNKNYPKIKDEVTKCYTYWCNDNIYYILNEIDDNSNRRLYLSKLRKYIKAHYKDIKANKGINFKGKYMISLLNSNVLLPILVFNLKSHII